MSVTESNNRQRSALILPLLLLAAVMGSSVMAASPLAWTATVTDQPITVDGRLDEPVWGLANPLPDLIQQDPRPGEPTPYPTITRVLVDENALYLGIVCHDPDPERIAVHTMQRDGGLRGDDTIALVLDTDGDQRRGYFFRVNAAGARQDGLISGPEEISTDWDGIWEARARRHDDGWTVEIWIPAQSLRFHWGLDSWGFNLERSIPRDRTVLRLTAATLNASLYDLQRAGELRGVGQMRQGKGLSFSPYGLLGLYPGPGGGHPLDRGRDRRRSDVEHHRRPDRHPHRSTRTSRRPRSIPDRSISPDSHSSFRRSDRLLSRRLGALHLRQRN